MGVSITECVREHDYFLEITDKQTNKQTKNLRYLDSRMPGVNSEKRLKI